MKGTGVAVATGLAALVATCAVGGAWLMEETLTAEAKDQLAAAGVEASVVFSGQHAVVTTDNAQVDRALQVVGGVPFVEVVTVEATPEPTPIPSPTPTLNPTPTPTPEPTPTPTPEPTPEPTPMPEVVIQFEGGSDSYIAGQDDKINQMAGWLVANPDAVVEVHGHTDNGRTERFREALAAERAQIVVNALVAAGAKPDQLVVVSMADKEPVASNDTAEGSAANRRVTFVAQGER